MAPLSFPPRIDPHTGGFVTVPAGSDAEATEAIALHVLTRTGERPMRPGYGTTPIPYGDGIDQGALQLQLTENGWGHLAVTGIDTSPTDTPGQVRAVVSWEVTG